MNSEYKVIVNKLSQDTDLMTQTDVIIREMCQAIDRMLKYRYSNHNYNKGNRDEVLKDKANEIKNSMSILLGDIDIYLSCLNVTDQTEEKKEQRLLRQFKKKNM